MQGTYDVPNNAIVFRWKSPGAGTVTLTTCNQTNSDTMIWVFKSTDGKFRYASLTNITSFDDGCGAGSGATFGTLQGITQGV